MNRPASRLLFLTLSACQCLVPVDEFRAVDAGPAWSTPQNWCAALLEAYVCGQAVACGGAAPEISCAQRVNAPGHHSEGLCTPRLLANLDAGVVVFDVDAGRACFERWQTVCGAENCVPQVFRGTRELGSPCVSNLECREGYCEGIFGCRGVCTAKGGDGAEPETIAGCSTAAAVMLTDGGLRCRSPGPTCAQAADELDPSPCTPGLVCFSGVCGPPRGEGEPCAAQARWGECARGLSCDPGTSTCAPLAGLGQPCRGGCLAGYSCDPARNVCTLPPTEGQSCAISKVCAAPLGCQAGVVCVRLGAAGASCSTTLDCEGPLQCNSGGRCQEGLPLGSPCANERDCAFGSTCTNGRCALSPCF